MQTERKILYPIKSNIVLAVLLFMFLCPLSSMAASWPVRDTIILDGDTVYIEKRQRIIRVDSLQEKLNDDIITKKINEHRFSMAVDLGWNQTTGTYQSAYQSYVPLDNFIDRKKSRIGNLSPALDIGFRIWEAPVKDAELHLSAHTGLRYNEINIRSSQLDETPFARDSLVKLEYIDNQLQLQYFTIFDTTEHGIIGELDTAVIATNQLVTHFRTWDFPFKIRTTYRPVGSKLSLFAEAGILYRRITPQQQTINDNYIVNSTAEFRRFEQSLFKTQNILTPMFSIGTAYHFIQSSMKEKHWSIQVCFTACLPSRALNPEGYFIMQNRNQIFSLAVRRTF